MIKGLETLKILKEHPFGTIEEFDRRLSTIEKDLKELEFIKKCFYVASSGAILLTDYGFDHKEELKEVLL